MTPHLQEIALVVEPGAHAVRHLHQPPFRRRRCYRQELQRLGPASAPASAMTPTVGLRSLLMHVKVVHRYVVLRSSDNACPVLEINNFFNFSSIGRQFFVKPSLKRSLKLCNFVGFDFFKLSSFGILVRVPSKSSKYVTFKSEERCWKINPSEGWLFLLRPLK